MKTLLAQAGYWANPATNIWSRPGYDGISYSDGDEVETRIAAIIAGATDLSVLSGELSQHISDWPSLYHLSATRSNILRPFRDILAGADVLEIGAGCGAITRYLGECGAKVLALEGTPRRAALARSRTRDLPSVEVVAEKFDNFKCERLFDVVTLIGVLEYANLFTTGPHPAVTMLQRARAMLKPTGKLIIAIENQLGLKYFAGAPEDHLGGPMYGIEARYRANQPQTYGRKALASLLTQAGFEDAEFLAPFPDYKLPVSIVTESGFACESFDSGALAWQSARRDPQLPHYLAFSPELVWPGVAQNGLALDLANSFLVLASNTVEERSNASVLAYHFSTERSGVYCKETRFVQTDGGTIELNYHSLAPDPDGTEASRMINFSFPDKAEYLPGKVLSKELIEVVTRDGWRIEEVGTFLKRYLHIATSLANDGGNPLPIDSIATTLPGMCFDLVPQNIIIAADGRYHAIDREWELRDGICAGWLVFRTLLLLVQAVTRFGKPASVFPSTRMGFFSAAYQSAGLAVSEAEINSFGNMEATVQSEVNRRPIDLVRNWWPDSALPFHCLHQALLDRDLQIVGLQQALADRDGQIAEFNHAVERDEQIAEFNRMLVERDGQIASLYASINQIRTSTSWRLTGPLRAVTSIKRKVGSIFTVLPQVLEKGGGVWPTLRRTERILRKEGVPGIRLRLRHVFAQQAHVTAAPQLDESKISFVPYYIDPNLDVLAVELAADISVAIHVHLDAADMLNELAPYLNNIPGNYDLYVSVSESADTKAIKADLKALLLAAKNVVVENVQQRGSDIAPMIVQFGRHLAEYEIIGHLHVESIGDQVLGMQCRSSLSKLMGPARSTGGRIAHIIDQLQTSAQIVFPDAYAMADGADGMVDDQVGRSLRDKYPSLPACELLAGALPVDTMFWARGALLTDLLGLPLEYADFPGEQGAADGALLRLALAFSRKQDGQYVRILDCDSIKEYRQYEEQHDYSDSISHADVKVLSYYLPQFHPTPENDLWHGKGFTEWTKVRAANPLFEGHYQQHIPHPDIGYYLLDTPETLRHQAELMKKSGVHGQVFYHYWFSGKLILDEPARMLMAAPDINMPFCFCWANENWTRRWDGNESEVLLGQNYSAQDARDFIQYLIPFFLDPRHIKVDGRPMLYVYRPSSIPNSREYLNIWEEECAKAGVLRPYVVAVLTRGATNPHDFGMDAGTERVLHDWTGGGVPEIQNALRRYKPINGSVLSYDEVAKFYMGQTEAKEFTYFRSTVPIWDNTARYGSQAYVLHGSTPKRFQEWMESTIAYSQSHLPTDRRFLLVNAWNEWAEGAHLEPDTRYGYSYLNAVGRALSGIPYAQESRPTPVPAGTMLQLSFPAHLLERLRQDHILRQRFMHCLSHSSVFDTCSVGIDAPELLPELPDAVLSDPAQADFVLAFRDIVFFDASTIATMLQSAHSSGAVVIANSYGGDAVPIQATENGSVDWSEAVAAPLLMLPGAAAKKGYKSVRLSPTARCFVVSTGLRAPEDKPAVTTIIRFHKSASLKELKNALYCLYAMSDCSVIPLIAAQDLSEQQTEALQQTLDDFAWGQACQPQVQHYQSKGGNGDLRSKMLNESLQRVQTRYVAFLDFDDLLMSHAYGWLLARLEKTGKAVAFGRVYSTSYDSASGIIMERRRIFEYGYSYPDFVDCNHSPLHSFMLDLERLDINNIVYFDDQLYMEDYLLTLQLFTRDNGDWAGLNENFYIGEYIHCIDRAHTLAISNEQERQDLLLSPDYMICEQRICDMRKKVKSEADIATNQWNG